VIATLSFIRNSLADSRKNRDVLLVISRQIKGPSGYGRDADLILLQESIASGGLDNLSGHATRLNVTAERFSEDFRKNSFAYPLGHILIRHS
jgi:hypothetical protein